MKRGTLGASRALMLTFTFTLALAFPLVAQAPPAMKGVWQPVNYAQDIELHDVFFATVDVGWAAGDAGTILFTKDGGKTWAAQLGGEPENKADAIRMLRFFDERHGWALQGRKLLRTVGGEEWEDAGTVPYGTADFIFVSPQIGFLAGRQTETSAHPQVLYRTKDGGRTWQAAWPCSAKVVVNGLTQNTGCRFESFQFPSAKVGYAVLGTPCVGMGCGPPPLIAKTEDGGETWRSMAGPGVTEQDYVTALFFTDEQTGFARLGSGKLHATKDGGATWRGIVASPGKSMRFADPGVAWSFDPGWTRFDLNYSGDGGTRWSARELSFPAEVNAMSIPRRDVAYAVGEHGMVYRYAIVKASQPLAKNEIAAPAMPAFASQLDTQVAQLQDIVKELAASVGSANASPDTRTAAVSAKNETLPAASAFTTKCCARSLAKLDATSGAASRSVQQLATQYRNLNLWFAGMRNSEELSAQYRAVAGGLSDFVKAESADAARAALSATQNALGALRQTTDVALQKQLPPTR